MHHAIEWNTTHITGMWRRKEMGGNGKGGMKGDEERKRDEGWNNPYFDSQLKK